MRELQNPETVAPLLIVDPEALAPPARREARDLFFRLGQWWARRSVGWVLEAGQTPPEVAPWELGELLDVEFQDVLSSSALAAWKDHLTTPAASDPRLTAFQEGWQALMEDFAERIEEYRHVLADFRQVPLEAVRFAGVGPVDQLLLETPDRLWVVATRERSRHFAEVELEHALRTWSEQAKSGEMKQQVYEFERAYALVQEEALQDDPTSASLVARLLQELRHSREFAVYSLADSVVCYDRQEYHLFWLKEPALD